MENTKKKKRNCYILIGIYLCQMCPLKGAEKKKMKKQVIESFVSTLH